MIPNYFYEGESSATRIIPELQQLRQGDPITTSPGYELAVSHLESNHSLVHTAGGDQGDSTTILWGYHLGPTGDGRTRRD